MSLRNEIFNSAVPEHILGQIEPYLPSSWNKNDIGQYGIYTDYINHPVGTQSIIGALWHEPHGLKKELYIDTIITYLPNTMTYRDYCKESLEKDNMLKIEQGQQPQDIETALHVLVDNIPQTQELDSIVLRLKAITKKDLENRNKLEEILRMMGVVLRLADSTKREQIFLKQYGLAKQQKS